MLDERQPLHAHEVGGGLPTRAREKVFCNGIKRRHAHAQPRRTKTHTHSHTVKHPKTRSPSGRLRLLVKVQVVVGHVALQDVLARAEQARERRLVQHKAGHVRHGVDRGDTDAVRQQCNL